MFDSRESQWLRSKSASSHRSFVLAQFFRSNLDFIVQFLTALATPSSRSWFIFHQSELVAEELVHGVIGVLLFHIICLHFFFGRFPYFNHAIVRPFALVHRKVFVNFFNSFFFFSKNLKIWDNIVIIVQQFREKIIKLEQNPRSRPERCDRSHFCRFQLLFCYLLAIILIVLLPLSFSFTFVVLPYSLSC